MNDLLSIIPELVVTLTAIAVLIVDLVVRGRWHLRSLSVVALGALIVAAVSASPRRAGEPYTSFNGVVLVDEFTQFFRVLFIVLAFVGILAADAYAARRAVPD